MPFPDEAILGINFFQHSLIHFISLMAFGHSWYRNESTCAEKKLIPQIASSRKGILLFSYQCWITQHKAAFNLEDSDVYDASLSVLKIL